jgi:hypothetical protein
MRASKSNYLYTDQSEFTVFEVIICACVLAIPIGYTPTNRNSFIYGYQLRMRASHSYTPTNYGYK